MEEKIITVYCPRCGRKILQTEERTTMVLESKCKKCNHLVIYNGENGKTKIGRVPQRKSSSGIRYY